MVSEQTTSENGRVHVDVDLKVQRDSEFATTVIRKRFSQGEYRFMIATELRINGPTVVD